MIHQFTVLVSVPFVLWITNELPAVIEALGTFKIPGVPAKVLYVTMMTDDAVTAVVFTVTVPPASVAVSAMPVAPVGALSGPFRIVVVPVLPKDTELL